MDFVPNFDPMSVKALNVQKKFMLSHGCLENDFDVEEWMVPEFAEDAARSLLT